MQSLTQLILQNKPRASLQTALGYFNPTGLHLELLIDPHDDREESKMEYLATLMHERTHWLQYVGTPVGLFLAYLSTAQRSTLLLRNKRGETPAIAETQLPLLDSASMNTAMRAAWYMAETEAMRISGAKSAYLEILDRERPRVTREFLSTRMRAYAKLAVGQVTDDWYELHDRFAEDEGFSNASGQFFESGLPGVALGGYHIMEAAARQNEIWMLTRFGSKYVVNYQRAWGAPYRIARDFFYEISGASRNSTNDAAFCVLADWALMCMLPPVVPLRSAEEGARDLISPAWLLAKLSQHYDADVIPHVRDTHPVELAEQLARALYADLAPKIDYPDPISVVALVHSTFHSIIDTSLPELICGEGGRQDIETTRLTYLSILAARAAVTRVQHPAFFALPVAYYRDDQAGFHRLFDPIQAPLWSVPGQRLYPSEERFEWFEFFYVAGVASDALAAAAYGDATVVADQLEFYRYASVVQSDEADRLFRGAIIAVFGDGEATARILDTWDAKHPVG